jgi:exopolyphosphatase/guanosine-5'-triphosphate,3'-diphosphate pyrophosphatase
VNEELDAARARYGGPAPDRAIAVAGTPTSMAAIELGLDAADYSAAAVEGHVLELPFLQKHLGRLASMPLTERREVEGLHPDRAPTIVAGLVILIGTMRAFGLKAVEVSENDVMLGAALEAA